MRPTSHGSEYTGDNLRERDRQRWQLLILVYFDKATSAV